MTSTGGRSGERPRDQEADAWWRHGVVYQIYPRSFADGNGDGIGDLAGIRARLDHLRSGPEALGVDAVWLSPFYRSPMDDFGYDVAEHTDVDPIFGTLDDADALIADAHERGLRVLVDWVPNHTSDRHPWFRAARADPTGRYRRFYVFRDPAADGGPPNNWRSSFPGVGAAWTHDERSGQYYLHSFLPTQPDLDWENPEVRAAMLDVARFWLARGVDGFRVDVVHKLGKDPTLADNEPGATKEPDTPPRHDEDWPNVFERLAEIRATLDAYDQRAAVGEVYLYDQRRLVEYNRSGLHLVHNFVFLRQPWRAEAFREVVDEFEGLAGDDVWPAWCLENHDHDRIVTRYGGGAQGERRARVAAVVLLTLRGTPFLYQGQELGLPNGVVPPERVVDVDGRDPVRVPMPWAPPSEGGPSAAFTSSAPRRSAPPASGAASGGGREPWLPVHPDAERLAVSRQSTDAASMLSWYRQLLDLRRRTAALRRGAYRSLDAGRDVFAYERRLGEERLAVVANFAPEPRPVAGVGAAAVVASTHRSVGPLDARELVLEGDEATVLRIAPI